MVGLNEGGLFQCHSTGVVIGRGQSVGGLVGSNFGYLFECHSNALVVGGSSNVGGLVGSNHADVTFCYSDGDVNGVDTVGGLVGKNFGNVRSCYSLGMVTAQSFYVGGFVGFNLKEGTIVECYDTGNVTNLTGSDIGGFAGHNKSCSWVWSNAGHGYVSSCTDGNIQTCFWDVNTSGLDYSYGGTGLTTVGMQTASTFLDAGWDFMGETANGTDDIWWILEGHDYPRLWWEMIPGRN